jgi:hypothetical protein
MPIANPPRSISEQWYQIDEHLMTIELAQASHSTRHSCLKKELSDHVTRLRSVSCVSGLFAGTGGLLAIIALIKSFLGLEAAMYAARTESTLKYLHMHGFYNGFFTTSENTDQSKNQSSGSCLFERSSLAI